MAVQIGPKIGIEGEKEYRQQIQQIIQQTKTLDSAMDKTASSWSKSTSQLTKNKAVAQNLTQQIELEKEKLSILNTMLEKSAEKFGENATQTQRWQRALNDTQTSINMMSNQLQGLGGAGNFSELSTKMADFGTRMQNVGQSIANIGSRMTAAITLPLAAAGAAAVKLASDTEEARNKVDVVFGSMSESVKEFAANSLTSYGLAEGSALQMAGTFGAMATSMGLSQNQAAKMSTTLTALAADMASFYNVSTEVAQTSLQGVFTGETEALKKFGIVMTQTNLEEFASRQGKVYDKMSEGEKVLTRYAFVMDATKDAQGDFGRTSDGAANSLRVFVESCKELGAAFGEAILPIITPIVQYITRLIQVFANLPAPIQKVIAVLGMIVGVIGPILVVIGTLMTSLGSIITQGPIIAAAFMNMIPAIQSLAGAFAELTLAAAPWILLAAAIAAAGVLVYQNWDSITAAAGNLADGIKSAYSKAMSMNAQFVNNVKDFAANVAQSFAQLPGEIINALSQAVQKVRDVFEQMINNAKKSGADFVEGFVEGIKKKVQKVVDAVKKVANTVKDFLGFSCPDKGPLHEYETWMPDFMMGLAKGIRSNMGIVKSAMNGVAKEMAIPISPNASMNMAMATAGSGSSVPMMGGTSMNVYVDHISELSDLIRIQKQAQQRYRMGAR